MQDVINDKWIFGHDVCDNISFSLCLMQLSNSNSLAALQKIY
jgi:hypothetical protein